MKPLETTGRTVEEAVQNALSTLGIKRDNALVEVLTEPAQGLFSFIGSKGARVSVTVRSDPSEYLKQFLGGILDFMGLAGKVDIEEDEEKISVSVSGANAGVLIGRRGRTLNELQYLLNTVLRRQFAGLNKMLVVDVESYRARRDRTLTQLAKSIARKVSADGHEQVLEPMTPQERRIIHLALQGYDDVVTFSKGEEPHRKVIIAPR